MLIPLSDLQEKLTIRTSAGDEIPEHIKHVQLSKSKPAAWFSDNTKAQHKWQLREHVEQKTRLPVSLLYRGNFCKQTTEAQVFEDGATPPEVSSFLR